MRLSDIVFSNLLRRKGKAVFVLAGLVIGISTVVAIISFSEATTRDINDKLEKYGANILVVPKTENLSLSYGGMSLGGVSFEMQEILEKDLERIKTIKNAGNVAATGPMVFGVVKINGRKVLLSGIDFDQTKILKPWWIITGSRPKGDEVVLGAKAAKTLGIEHGSSFTINGREFLVSGILQDTGSQDDQLVFTQLATAQSVLGKEGRISMAEVAALCTACPIEEMVRQISEAIPSAKVMAIQSVVKGRMKALDQFRKFSYGVSAVVILIGSLVVLVTMMGSVRERTSEIGIFRAIGFRRSHVIKIVLFEAAIISGLAGIVGYLGGLGITKLALMLFAESDNVPIYLSAKLALGAILLSLLVGMLASIYPALMAARMDPNDALRSM